MSISFEATCTKEECKESIEVYVAPKNQAIGLTEYQYTCPSCKKTISIVPAGYEIDFERTIPDEAIFAVKVEQPASG